MTHSSWIQARRLLRRPTALLLATVLALGLAGPAAAWPAATGGNTPSLPAALPYPILFVTQVPIAGDFTTVSSTFGNQRATLQSAGRGGDLWIRYPNGSLRNLTHDAGFGGAGLLTGNAGIAVRDPAVYWDGTKAVFSMVVGAPAGQNDDSGHYFWQLYEITGLGASDTPVITKVPHQPANFNNISPTYGSDDRIIFTSDRPRNGQSQLYPQRDEYELAPTTTGVWSLNPATGDLRLLNQAPSGDFTPSVNSFGRVIFTQWDHLQRDQEADADAAAATPGQNCYYGNPVGQLPFGTFNYSNETASATYVLTDRTEVFPEPRTCRADLLQGTNLAGHSFNQFFPWTINQDGTSGETLNHIGRHELAGYIPASITGDPKVYDYYGQDPRFNPNPVGNLLQIKEDPLHLGTYYARRRARICHAWLRPDHQPHRPPRPERRSYRRHLHHDANECHRPLPRATAALRWHAGRRSHCPDGRCHRHRLQFQLRLPSASAHQGRRRFLVGRLILDRRDHQDFELLGPLYPVVFPAPCGSSTRSRSALAPVRQRPIRRCPRPSRVSWARPMSI